MVVVVVQASDLTNELNQLKVTSTPPTQTEAGRLAVPGLSRRLPIAQTGRGVVYHPSLPLSGSLLGVWSLWVQVMVKAAQDKAAVYEKQLDVAQRRLDALTTSGTYHPPTNGFTSVRGFLLRTPRCACVSISTSCPPSLSHGLCMWSVSGTASAIAANEAAEKEMEVQRLTAELEGAKVRRRQPATLSALGLGLILAQGRHSRDRARTEPHLLQLDVH